MGARLNAHTELWVKRQRFAREAIYRNRSVAHTDRLRFFHSFDVRGVVVLNDPPAWGNTGATHHKSTTGFGNDNWGGLADPNGGVAQVETH
jgi:hypothetical protein